jgi:hypothetical protein
VKFADLPLFATDHEIAEAVVGKARVKQYLTVIERLDATDASFPKVDKAHGGRYTPAVKLYYDTHHGLRASRLSAVDQPERAEAWTSKRRAGGP